MAKKTKTYSSDYAHPSTRYWIDLVVTENSTDRSTNSSNITFDLRARSEPTWDLEFSGRLGYIEIQINGGEWQRIASSYTDLAAWDGDGGAYNKRICSVTKNITHNSDGKLNIKVKGYYDYSNILISHKWWINAVSVTGVFTTTAISLTPTYSASISNQTAESITFDWSSDIPLKSVSYTINNKDYTTKTIKNKKSGSITITGLSPNKNYTVKTYGTSTSNTKGRTRTLSAKTVSVAKITSSVDFIFGSSLPVTKTNSSGFSDDIYFYINNQLICKKTNAANSCTITFTQNNLDTMYKLFGNKNTATSKITVVTKGSSDYKTSKTGTMTLNGNAKTVHVGINRVPLRAKVYIGIGKVPKRAVVWIGNNDKPKRCI